MILEGISGLRDSWNALMCFVENDVDAAMAMNAWWWAPCKCIFTCKAPITRPSGIMQIVNLSPRSSGNSIGYCICDFHTMSCENRTLQYPILLSETTLYSMCSTSQRIPHAPACESLVCEAAKRFARASQAADTDAGAWVRGQK